MNAAFDPPPSKGMAMIAAYRAARLSQRPIFRASLQQSRGAPPSAYVQRPGRVDPARAARDDGSPADAEAGAAGDAGPVFTDPVSIVVAEQGGPDRAWQTGDRPADDIQLRHDEPDSEEAPAPAPQAVSETEPAASAAPVYDPTSAALHPARDPPLAEIGFGPGMLFRLSQLGLHTTRDLARADAGKLRAALGEISRLFDVDAWIENAQQAACIAPIP